MSSCSPTCRKTARPSSYSCRGLGSKASNRRDGDRAAERLAPASQPPGFPNPVPTADSQEQNFDVVHFSEFSSLPELEYTFLGTTCPDETSVSVLLKVMFTNMEKVRLTLLYLGNRKGNTAHKACCSNALILREPAEHDGKSGELYVRVTITKSTERKRLPEAFFRLRLTAPNKSAVTAPFTLKIRGNEGLACSLEALAIDYVLRQRIGHVVLLQARMDHEKGKLGDQFKSPLVEIQWGAEAVEKNAEVKFDEVDEPQKPNFNFSMEASSQPPEIAQTADDARPLQGAGKSRQKNYPDETPSAKRKAQPKEHGKSIHDIYAVLAYLQKQHEKSNLIVGSAAEQISAAEYAAWRDPDTICNDINNIFKDETVWGERDDTPDNFTDSLSQSSSDCEHSPVRSRPEDLTGSPSLCPSIGTSLGYEHNDESQPFTLTPTPSYHNSSIGPSNFYCHL